MEEGEVIGGRVGATFCAAIHFLNRGLCQEKILHNKRDERKSFYGLTFFFFLSRERDEKRRKEGILTLA